MLNAKHVISAGGQWNLYDYEGVTDRYYFLNKYKDNVMCNQYYDLSKRLKTNRVPILYMYGGLNASDINQIGYAKDIQNIYPIAIKSKEHAQRVSIEPYLRLLCASREDITNIYDTNKEGLVEIRRLEEQINQTISLPKGLEIGNIITGEQKRKAYVELLYNWVKSYQDIGAGWFSQIHSQTVAIWGKGKICSLLIKELNKQNTRIKCIVETQPIDMMFEDVPIVDIKHLPDEVDTLIVVPYYDLKEIRENVFRYYPKINVIGIDKYINGG